jgi:DNA-binding CsgD family transcriptional regulator
MGCALHALAFVRMRDRDHAGAVACCRQALDALGDDVETTDLRLLLMANYAAALNDADRLAEARDALSQAVRLAEQAAPVRLSGSRLQRSSMLFEWGEWDDALTELDDLQLPHAGHQVIQLFLRAKIALHRGDTATREQALDALAGQVRRSPWAEQVEIESQAEAAEQAGDARRLLAALRPLLDGGRPLAEVTLNLWLPVAVRAALTLGETATAVAAERVAAVEAARSRTPTMEAIAAHCRGLLEADGPMIAAGADQLAAVGRPLPAGQAYEDAAVAHAAAGNATAARACLEAALGQYSALGARFDIRRATSRVRPYGIRPVRREPPQRPTTGWAALTPAQVKVAELLRLGRSNPDIAAELSLSRHTVESHVSRILTKLGAKSRMEVIAAARPPQPDDQSA